MSFNIRRGEVFGLAGESGSGKSTIGRCVIGMEKPTAGTVCFDEIDLAKLPAEEMRRLRRRMQVIYQDPLASLNPRMTIGDAIMQGLKIHYADRAAEHRDLVIDMIQRVGLTPPDFYYNKYPAPDFGRAAPAGGDCPGADHPARADPGG